MPIREDVLVVGGGLAAATSALAAAESGKTVRLVAHKKSTLRQASGLIDVLGYTDGDGPHADPYAAISDLPDDHPYKLVGEDGIKEGLRIFDEAVGEMYAGGHTDTNALVPTYGGTVKPTARYPKSVEPGLASVGEPTLFVGFEGTTDFAPQVVADHVAAAGVPFETRGVRVPFPKTFRDDARLTRLAKALDKDESAGRVGVRRSLAETVKAHLEGEERVGFPAMLGDAHGEEVRAELEDRLGVSVFEVPTGPPSLLGLQLEDRLFDALDEAGVRISTGNPAVGYEADGDRIEAVYVDRRGNRVPYHAEEFVLATGGLVGKGIDSDRERVTEPVFGCHIPHPDDRYDWSDEEAFGGHEFARFGVVPDEEMRPTTASGEPHFENLRAAGSVVGGADVAREKSASGVSLATGAVAGSRAGEEA
ncbi:anaerobic glycerol-3-phosphate dehydrogenase subunit B [Halogeometricum borinquense DSM 11551]|uniref:Anaerobic glycerol-3-phosphate dehydrogenase subunit B n=2 Tax=Halogeometricum borinquense TaxID=60847 RepID=E4NLQ5_HALBP|nr:glycerol-3-phosphate dehydrogenase subunit GlpB [Halogeometricum borinquense]ADQ67258.1 glycerol 3-phosphate dehydrogenase (quinone) subunit B [Halogeometricum borinquense DSM 11551]ELY28474.1 anaerobic glycerol-3-phosphate dehydrogenase subunit B [Halogeometricum borinquense DSM 11551]RYJ13794.1 glycerol-3-phosphate dehydrogenase subunit GlpB [Halogeometricum borinquense]